MGKRKLSLTQQLYEDLTLRKGESNSEIAKSPIPLTLKYLKTIDKNDLIEIILLREISYKELWEEWHDASKEEKKNEFLRDRIQILMDQNNLAKKYIDLKIRHEKLKKRMGKLYYQIKKCSRCYEIWRTMK